MEKAESNIANGTILCQLHHGNSSIMEATDEEETILRIHIDIIATHTTDPVLVHLLKVTIGQDIEGCNTLIFNGIEMLTILRDGYIRRIIDWSNCFLAEYTSFRIHIIYMNTNTIGMCIGSYVCNVLFFCHGLYLLFLSADQVHRFCSLTQAHQNMLAGMGSALYRITILIKYF